MLAANPGSTDTLSYTLIGSTVNIASRIEQLTKKLSTDIFVSKETVDRLTDQFLLTKNLPQPVQGF